MTDAGIEGLCVSGQCKSIQLLTVLYTKVTKKGVKTALKNLPALKSFDHPDLYQALVEMHQECSEQKLLALPKYSLVSLDWIGWCKSDGGVPSPYISGCLAQVTSLCSSITIVRIEEVAELTDQDLLGLLFLESLKDLSILYEKEFDLQCLISFEGGLAPVLKKQGKFLNSLKLVSFHVCVNIRVIIEYCPNLEYLMLGYYYTVAWQEEGIFSCKRIKRELWKLKSLIMHCNPETKPEIPLLLLSSAPALKSLKIHKCDALTDEVFGNVFKFHPFQYLLTIQLLSCNRITKKGIDLFMSTNNPLSCLFFYGCDLVTHENIAEWEDLALKNKWNLEVSKNKEIQERLY